LSKTSLITFKTLWHRMISNDLGYQGDVFTWSNNQTNIGHIKERLDRFCANSLWIQTFPHYNNYHLASHPSDYNPIMLVFSTNKNCRNSKTKATIKRFEQIWLQSEDIPHIVRRVWKNSSIDITQKLSTTMDHLYLWGKGYLWQHP